MSLFVLLAVAALSTPEIGASNDAAPRPPAVEKAAARSSGALEGVSVRVRCLASATGRVSDCHVVSETRPGLGFGEAAVALMNGADVQPALRDGKPVRASFEHTIEFTP